MWNVQWNSLSIHKTLDTPEHKFAKTSNLPGCHLNWVAQCHLNCHHACASLPNMYSSLCIFLSVYMWNGISIQARGCMSCSSVTGQSGENGLICKYSRYIKWSVCSWTSHSLHHLSFSIFCLRWKLWFELIFNIP